MRSISDVNVRTLSSVDSLKGSFDAFPTMELPNEAASWPSVSRAVVLEALLTACDFERVERAHREFEEREGRILNCAASFDRFGGVDSVAAPLIRIVYGGSPGPIPLTTALGDCVHPWLLACLAVASTDDNEVARIFIHMAPSMFEMLEAPSSGDMTMTLCWMRGTKEYLEARIASESTKRAAVSLGKPRSR